MSNRDKWRLCGGTFFILISDARKAMPSHDEMYMGKKSGITEPETLFALAKIVTPDLQEPLPSEEKSWRDGTFDFKSCKGWGWKQFRFRDSSVKASFDSRIKNDYSKCLKQMTTFTNKYLDLCTSTKKDEYLVKAILELLKADKTIDDETEFYAKFDGTLIKKRDLLAPDDEICFEAFLLGIWHYCIVSIKQNSIGKDTYAEWCPRTEGNNDRPYEAAIGEKSSHKVKITYCQESDFDFSEGEESTNKEDAIEQEVIDPTPEQENDSQTTPQSMSQTVNNPIVLNITMNQSGNGKQVGYINNYYEKDNDNE